MAPLPVAPIAFLALTLGIAVPSEPANAQDLARPIGIVDAVSGRWRVVQDRRAILPGQLLYDGETISSLVPATGSIKVLVFAGNTWWQRTCTENAPCVGSLRPAGAGTESRGFWAFLSSFWQSGRQLPPVLAGARGVTAGAPTHALLLVGNGDVDLSPALHGVSPGRYVVRLAPAPDANASAGSAARDMTVSIGADGRVRVPPLPLGLFVMTISDEAGQTIGSSALILVRRADDAAAAKLWAAASDAAGAPELDAATRSALLAQTLYALNSSRD